MKPNFDSEGFMKAYDAHADAIFRFFYFRVFDREKAKDLAQDTFTKTWQYLVNGNEVRNLKAFLYQVARNLVIDYSRKKTALSLDDLHEKGFDPHTDHREGLYDSIDARHALSLVKNLDEKYREVLLMRFVDGFSPREIARELKESENVVSVRIHRALKQIRKLLET